MLATIAIVMKVCVAVPFFGDGAITAKWEVYCCLQYQPSTAMRLSHYNSVDLKMPARDLAGQDLSLAHLSTG